MMQESEKIPFDLNHCRILTYKDFGEVLDDEEAEKIQTVQDAVNYIDSHS